jgi:outer membrane protein assembly factor BamB
MKTRITVTLAAAVPLLSVLSAVGAERSAADAQVAEILEKCNVSGGLIVHVGCGDGRLAAALGAEQGRLVQGLARTADEVNRARRLLRSTGLYGRVTIDRMPNDDLPYADNAVNLVVSEDLGGIPVGEVIRVLAPGGKACLKRGDDWKLLVKPRPDTLDQWTHFLYDATNNAVCHDTAVDTPHHVQWVGAPKWARSHDHLASISAVVSAGGRLYYIVDEGPTAAVALPAEWNLVARDAFSGVVLWKKPIGLWEGHLRGFRTGPHELPRRLVADADGLYVTLGYGQPVSRLDGATGELIRTYPQSEGTLEIVHRDGVLYLVTGEMDLAEAARRRGGSPPPRGKRLLAIDAAGGQTLWQKHDGTTKDLLPLTLAVDGRGVYFQNAEAVVCLDAATGQQRWRTARQSAKHRWTWSTPTLVVHGDVVLSADRAADSTVDPGADGNALTESADAIQWVTSSTGGEAPQGELIAYSAKDGRELWRAACRETYNAPVDVLVVGDLVFSGEVVRARDPGITVARDVHTGEVKMQRPRDQDFFSFGMGHHRCYRNKATDNYLLMGRSGIELLDVANGEIVANHFVRGACQYGIMPCNGLLYVPSHSCACFIQAKLSGFNALASKAARAPVKPLADDKRLERGPAYGDSQAAGAGAPNPKDWPTYRRGPARTGFAPDKLPSAIGPRWEAQLAGPLTPPVIAEGKLLVAAPETHTIHALDAAGGEPLWEFTAGGRVDGPPTVYQGLVLFGSADGYVYCLRGSDGALVWRFLAAPADRRIVAYGQLESIWPVPGNVLIVEDPNPKAVAYFVAGRSSYVDGGMRLYRLRPRSGELLSITPVDNRDPASGLPPQFEARGTTMPGVLPDALSCDGSSVYLRHLRFDLGGNPQEPNVDHLFSPAGFTDDSWWHRTYWIYGTDMKNAWGGWTQAGYQVPAGRLLVLDDESIFAFGRLNQYATHGAHVGLPRPLLPWPPDSRDARTRGQTHYVLFATSRERQVAEVLVGQDQTEIPAREAEAAVRAGVKPRKQSRVTARWARELDVTVRAMVLAGRTLYVAGPPELLSLTGRSIAQQDLRAVKAAYDGKRGGMLWAVSAEDGSKLAEHRLDAPPVFDGLVAAHGCLFLTTTDGRVHCLGEK